MTQKVYITKWFDTLETLQEKFDKSDEESKPLLIFLMCLYKGDSIKKAAEGKISISTAYRVIKWYRRYGLTETMVGQF